MGQESGRKTPKSLDIALVHWAFPPTVGGVESYLWNCSRLLARQGHRVTVFTGTPDPRTPPEPGVEVLSHPGLDLSRVMGGVAEREALRQWFGDELGRRQIRLVHGHNLHHFSTAPAEALLALRDRLGLVLLHTYHSMWQDPESVAIAKPCGGFDVSFAVSEFLRGACVDALGIEGAKSMYLGIDTVPYLQVPELSDPEPKEEAIILLPARLIPDKGALTALEAMAKVVREDLPVWPRLILMNTPDSIDFHGEKIGFRETVDTWGKSPVLADHVDFDQAGVDGMVDLYRRARVVICPSKFPEPMGLAALEAMCSARPVIATDVGGLAEGVGKDGSTGFLVPPDDSGALADRLVQLLRAPALCRSVGNAARKRAIAEFDLSSRCLPLLIEAYEDSLGAAAR
ncbi:glycosyltransferase family 4 protein [Streptomyces panaciradicis]|uniref:glycosyltransferase family 4 protein n=1 Tax=Streptomyces panaciradicis TaxID=1470261 RepID=UPI00201D0C09|nr:glycosyltransferase family 4 protein [Streptomyces panaciradicis]MCL6674556.1 glycosyltransferase family 4 protein [Streptomyces panaciradicis]